MEEFKIAIETKGGGGVVLANEVLEAGEGDMLDARLYDREMLLCRRELCLNGSGFYDRKMCIHRIAYRDIVSAEMYHGESGYIDFRLVCRSISFDTFWEFEDVEACRERVCTPAPKLIVSATVNESQSLGFLNDLFRALKTRLEGEGDVYSLIENRTEEDDYQKQILIGRVGRERRDSLSEEDVVDFVTSQSGGHVARSYLLLSDAILLGENRGEWVEERIPLANWISLVEKPYGRKTVYVLSYREGTEVRTLTEPFIYNDTAKTDFLAFFEKVRSLAPSFQVVTPLVYRARMDIGDEIKQLTTKDGTCIRLCRKGFSVAGNECLYRDVVCIDNVKTYGGYKFTVDAKGEVPFGAWIWLDSGDLQNILDIYNTLVTFCRLHGAKFTLTEFFQKKSKYHLSLVGPLGIMLPAPKIYRGLLQHTFTLKGDGFEIRTFTSGERLFVPYGDVLCIESNYEGVFYVYTKRTYVEVFDEERFVVSSLRKKLLERVKKHNPEVKYMEYNGLIYI